MNTLQTDLCVDAVDVTKFFHIYHECRTSLRTLKDVLRGGPETTRISVFEHMNFRIHKGDRIALVGRNGCGKTTLLRLISGIYQPNSGAIRIFEEPRTFLYSYVGLQGFLPVEDNLRLAAAINGFTRPLSKREIDSILDKTGLSPLRKTLFKDLSGGQRTRFSFGVFFILEGNFFIFDDIFSSLDKEFLKSCADYFAELKERQKTFIMTSHDSSLLRKYCQSALWIDGGKVIMQGPADEVIGAYERSF